MARTLFGSLALGTALGEHLGVSFLAAGRASPAELKAGPPELRVRYDAHLARSLRSPLQTSGLTDVEFSRATLLRSSCANKRR
jgi:hypothetical protein